MSPRGRPREFEPDRVLDQALDVFWTRGYAASSLDELGAAMGIARPSLYKAFGDKEALYLATLERFRDGLAETFRACVAEAATQRAGILGFLRASIERYTAGDTARGCLVLCTGLTDAPTVPRVKELLANMIAELDAGYTTTLRAARSAGELPRRADVAALGRLLGSTQHSIAMRARAGATAAELDRIVVEAVAIVFSSERASRR
jgi:AcrR family transcriptional regulator